MVAPEPASVGYVAQRDPIGAVAFARIALEEALGINERDEIARLALACVLDEQGRTSAAVEQLRITLADHDETEATWFALGFCLEKLGDEEGAVASYERALTLTPNLRNAHERLAAIHLKNDRIEAAILRYEHICFWSFF